MKVGTASKITIGTAGLIAIIFIGFVGVRQIRAPQVEERVYLSPWEDVRKTVPKNWLPKLILLKIWKSGIIRHKLLQQRPLKRRN